MPWDELTPRSFVAFEKELNGTDQVTLYSSRVIVATGSETAVPLIEGPEPSGYWTNREATTIAEPPESIAILGGGPVGSSSHS
jgi:dihydrolipoamide dehydrogenase